jgi:hypothetical protein
MFSDIDIISYSLALFVLTSVCLLLGLILDDQKIKKIYLRMGYLSLLFLIISIVEKYIKG